MNLFAISSTIICVCLAPVPPNSNKNYFPKQIGAKKIFGLSNYPDIIEEHKINDIKQEGENTTVLTTISVYVGSICKNAYQNKAMQTRHKYVNIRATDNGRILNDPLISFPCTVDKTWECTWRGPKGEKLKAEYKILGINEITTVPAGTFPALKVSRTFYFEGELNSIGTDWYVHDIGLIKSEYKDHNGSHLSTLSLLEYRQDD